MDAKQADLFDLDIKVSSKSSSSNQVAPASGTNTCWTHTCWCTGTCCCDVQIR